MSDVLLEVRDVSYRYEDTEKPAVSHVSFSVPRGAFYAVMGQNGSGKSTLAKLLNGLYLPTEGKVFLDGMDTSDEKLQWEIRRRAGMVFQNPDNQLVSTIVEEDVAFGLENLGVPTAEMPGRIREALESVGMLEYISRSPHMLSGGQKQRIAIAGILAMRPDMIIFDESTAMLDPQGRKEIFASARKLNLEKGITVLWITHFMEEAALCDRVLLLAGGEKAAEATPREIFGQKELLRACSLKPPVMTGIAQDLRAAGIPIRDDILTVDEMVKEVLTLCG